MLHGTWEGNDGFSFYRLVIGPETLLLNDVTGEVVIDFVEIEGGYRGEIVFGERTYVVDYYESPIDGTIHVQLTLDDKAVNLYRAEEGVDRTPSLPAVFQGTWTGVNLDDPEDETTYSFVVGEDGKLTINGEKTVIWQIDTAASSAEIEWNEERYEIGILDSMLQVSGPGFRALLEKEGEDPVDPVIGIYVPEDETWFGTWRGTDAADVEHVLIVSEDGKWSLDGAYAEEILFDGTYITLRYDLENTKESYYLRLVKGATTTVEVTSLSITEPWILLPEHAIEPILLPEEWHGTWTGTDTEGVEHTLVVLDDGSFTFDGVAGVATEVDDYGYYTFLIEGVEYTANLQANDTINFYSFAIGLQVTLEREQEVPPEPIAIPDALLGVWVDAEKTHTLEFKEDDTFTLDGVAGEILSLDETDGIRMTLEVSDVSYELTYVPATEDAEEEIVLVGGEQEIRFGREKTELEVVIPEAMFGTWESTDGHQLVIDAESVVFDGTAGTFLTDFEDKSDDYGTTYVAQLLFGETEYELEYSAMSGFSASIYLTTPPSSWNSIQFKKKEETGEDPVVLPDFLIGTWTGSGMGGFAKLTIQEDGTVLFNNQEAESVTAYDEALATFSFDLGGYTYKVTYETVPFASLKVTCIDAGIVVTLSKQA